MDTMDRLEELTFEHAPLGMSVQRLDGRFVRVNRALCELLGYDEAQLLSASCTDITHPDDRLIPELTAGRLPGKTVEKRYLDAAGEPVWVSVAVAILPDAAGDPAFLVSYVQDVSERRRVEDDLRHAADHDSLTGLLNRRRFERDLARQVELCRRYGQTAAVVLLDLDHLKRVNDTRGHQAGDALLAGAARVLAERLRASDVLARLGGDEFAVLLPLVGADEALGVAVALVRAVGELDPFGCTASAGVTLMGAGCPSAGQLLDAADRAMYAAKNGGRDRALLG